jgi:hypothetical protein
LAVVAKESGYPDLVLRPLSAKLLDPTKPERERLVDRERLLDFRGRSRKRQMALAAEFGITEYPSPAGGCRLTDPGYSRRLRDLLDRESDAGADDMRLLALGRHLRLAEKTRFVLGRNKEENEKLEGLFRPGDLKLFVRGVMGPTGLLRGSADEGARRLAASICVRYSDAPRDKASPVRLVPIPNTMTGAAGVEEELSATPAPAEVIDPRII